MIVVDVAEAALDMARERAGDRRDLVTWIAADVRHLRLSRQVDVWHDRAVFHFLTEEVDRQAYLDSVRVALKVGGHVVIATFALEGPERCSGLPVQRYDPAGLSVLFGPDFELLHSLEKVHVTPSGAEQEFTYAVFRREH